MKYREETVSRFIYQFRHLQFTFLRLLKKVKKVWKQREEYCTKDFWRNRASKEGISGSKPPISQSARLEIKDDYDDSGLSEHLAVYTCIYGPYDMICEPLYKSKWCEYYIITDQDVPKNSAWKKVVPIKPEGFITWSNAVKNRYFKMHPEVLFPKHKYSLYIDGNVKLLADVYPFIQVLGKRFIGIFKYPLNDCFYMNAPFLESLGLVPPELSKKQVETYQKSGFPKHFGYFECGVLLRRHNDPGCIRLMNTWWEQYCTWVKRDQQALPYSLWKNGLTRNDVACLGDNLRKTERFTVRDHKKKHSLVVGGPKGPMK